MNRDKKVLIYSSAAFVVAALLFLFLYTGEPPITPVGEQVNSNATQGTADVVNLADDLQRTQYLAVGGKNQLNFTENIAFLLVPKHGGGTSFGGGGGGGGGTPSDTTPPIVTGIFSRPVDTTNNEYNEPVTVTWVGNDGPTGSGIAFCDSPTRYSGPDGTGIVLRGHCTDNAHNLGTGNVTLNYNSNGGGNLAHSYGLSLSNTEITVGSGISATATTSNTGINNVKFLWKAPDSSLSANHTKPTTSGSSTDLFTAPSITGVWAVEAHFLDTANNDVRILTENFAVVQTSGSPGSHFKYSLTANPDPVQKNNPITANATTNNTGITNVNFVWTDPSGTVRATHVQTLSSTFVLDSFTPDIIGNWRVDAHFNNSTHNDVAIRLKSFVVIQGDITPPTVTGIFSREPDVRDSSNTLWYIHPVTITWVGNDGPDGSGIAFCDEPITYSGPNVAGVMLEGHCTDNSGNVGTGSVTFNFDTTVTGQLLHSYDLSLNSISVQLGSSNSANATTNNADIKDVRFVWRNPLNGAAADNVILTISHSGLRSAVNLFVGLNQTGIWAVEGHFLDNASNEAIVITRIFTVVNQGEGSFVYELTVTPETVETTHSVSANASTDDSGISNVSFVWTNPHNIVEASRVQPMTVTGTVTDSLAPFEVGVWRVDAHFNNATHLDVAIRSKSFTVIKEGGGGGGDHAPVAMNDRVTTPEDNPIVIHVLANDTDADGDHLAISSFTPAAHGSITKNANGTFTYSPYPNFNGQDYFTYRITDGTLQSNNATVRISVTPVNDAPIANAGPDQTVKEKSCTGSGHDGEDDDKNEKDSHKDSEAKTASHHDDGNDKGGKDCPKLTVVTLSGAGSSDPDNDVLTYSWMQTRGPTAKLSNATSVSPTFTVPNVDNDSVLTFEITVSDGFGGKSSDSVNIRVLDSENDSGGHGGGGGDGSHDCNGEEHDDHNCKCDDERAEHESKDKVGRENDKCGAGGGGSGHDDGKDKHDEKEKDRGNDNKGAGDSGKGGKDDHSGSVQKDNGSSGGDRKENESDQSSNGANDSCKQSSGSHDDSGPKKENGGPGEKNSGGSDNKDSSTSGAKAGQQGPDSQGSGGKNKSNDNGGSSSGSSGGHEKKGEDKRGNHDKKDK